MDPNHVASQLPLEITVSGQTHGKILAQWQMTVVTVVGLTINSGGKVFDMIFFLG